MSDNYLLKSPSGEIRIFLSSTFRDFMQERDLLVKEVFPELRRKARERGVDVVDVDLRWGITEEESEQGKVIPICLGEIDRCRPYFVGMLGDRYGWIPPADQYSAEVRERQPWLQQHLGGVSVTELEILHGVLNDSAMAGRAFFYFRDSAWSQAQTEPGFVCATADEKELLEALKQRIRVSGFPVAEQLADPNAIADQIGADLWQLIEQQYPEQAELDGLAKEERKHASYRNSRLGVYLGGDHYINTLNTWIDAGQQSILITGESGSGKSALIANWMEAHQQAHPEDVVYAHHLGCSNDASAIRPLLQRLIETAKQQLPEIYGNSLDVPQDWWELIAKASEALQSLGRWAQQNNHRWIWVLDGLDRLDVDDQNALPWLPLTIPDGVVIVGSALDCPARKILLERRFTTLTIGPLKHQEQDALIQQYLGQYTKQLIAELRQKITNHQLGGSPLFLRVLLEELRQCGRYETLADQLDGYLKAKAIDDLYDLVLERLEADGNGGNVRKVMTAIWASRAGLSEEELLAITGLAPLQWAPIDLALEQAFGRNGNRLVFDHDYLRQAVEDRYLPSDEAKQQAHSDLADWFEAREGWDERKAEELPWQWQQAGRLEDLRNHLLNPGHLADLNEYRGSRETINYWLAVKGLGDGELDELIANGLDEEIEKRRKNSDDLIRFVDQIASLFDEAGLYREPLLKLRALPVELEKASGERSEEAVLNSLLLLANAHLALGTYDTALPLYQRCLEASERLLGPEHPDTLATLNNLGLLYSNKRDYEQQETYNKLCLEACERVLGPEHPDTLITTSNLGLLYSNKGDYKQAEAYTKRCLEALERLLGPEHPSTLTTINNLGQIYSDMADYEQAEAYTKRCLEARERRLGPNHPTTLTTIDNLAGLFENKGDYEQAEVFYKQCLEASERVLGPGHPDTLILIDNLAGLLSKQDRYAESIPLRRQELAWYRPQKGDTDQGTMTSINRLAIDLRDNGELEEAVALFRELLASRQKVLEPRHFEISRTMGGLAKTLEMANELEEALEFRKQSLEHRLTHEGDDHYLSNRGRLDEARVLHKLKRSAEALQLLDALEASMAKLDNPGADGQELLDQAKALKGQII